ncbi:polysaccharide pyruvyl transferase family protein [Vibrio sp. BS-M-Sm-2]|uniref:polysaccharide pyruvyl transferase family protein n=1 Tax=Vibrio sp. BS-M-Sm-2 TaxID=3241167 RepID=UPI0035569201
MFNSISLYDPSISTKNVGDEIISESVQRELRDIFPLAQVLKFSSHSTRSIEMLKRANNNDISIIGGSNLLSPRMLRYRQFKVNILDLIYTKDLVLMGTGWQYYQNNIDILARFFYKNNFSSKYIHSVRDDYTVERLKSIGFDNVINTGCPTMWRLDESHCKQIPTTKSDNVIFTLTDYSKDLIQDRKLIESLKLNYNNIFYWPQGLKDLDYIKELGMYDDVKVIPPRLPDYNDFLDFNDCDYIGTRLHGGIKALQKKKRTIIIGIDNRALEKQKDFNIKVLARDAIQELDEMINSDFKTNISLNQDNILKFKEQFVS